MTLLTGVYAITDPSLLPGDQLFSGVESALRGGVRLLQYRNKRAPQNRQLEEALKLKALCQQYSAKLIVNDSLALCQSVDADGLHLGRSDGTLPIARAALGNDKIIGVTCHDDLAYAEASYEQGADYCAFGRMFTSTTKPDAPACPIEVLQAACKKNYPVVAIGGIDLENAPSLLAAGVNMIALIQGLFGQRDIEQSAAELCQLFKQDVRRRHQTDLE